MSVILAPVTFILTLLLIITTLVSRLFSVLSALISYIIALFLIKIDSDKFAKIIFSFLSICDLTGYINRVKEEQHEQKEIQPD